MKRKNKIKNNAYAGIVVGGAMIGTVSAVLGMPLVMTTIMWVASLLSLVLID